MPLLVQSAAFVYRPELATDLSVADDGPFSVRLSRWAALTEALEKSRIRVEGSSMWEAHGGNAEHWTRRAEEETSPYGNVDRLNSVCWLEFGSAERLPPGDWACLMRVKVDEYGMRSESFAMELRSNHAKKGVIITQGNPSPLRTSSVTSTDWIWLYFGRVVITTDAVLTLGHQGDGSYPGVAIDWYVLAENGSSWKSGLKLDHVKVVPWECLGALLEGAPGADEIAKQVAAAHARDGYSTFNPSVTRVEHDLPPIVKEMLSNGWAVQPKHAYWNIQHPGVVLFKP